MFITRLSLYTSGSIATDESENFLFRCEVEVVLRSLLKAAGSNGKFNLLLRIIGPLAL